MATPNKPSGRRGGGRSLDFSLRCAVATGGAAGNITATGVKVGDILVAVLREDATTGVTLSNLLSEFNISATNQINNTGGTATTGSNLLVWYLVTSGA